MMKIRLVTMSARVLAVVLFTLASLHEEVEAGRQCKLEERQNLQMVRVQSPARILLERSGVKRREDCYKACCHAHTAGCNAAAYFLKGKVGVCQLLKCEPFNRCIWKPSPHSTVGRIRGATLSPLTPAGISLLRVTSGNHPKSIPPPGKKNPKKNSAGKSLAKPNASQKNKKGKMKNKSNAGKKKSKNVNKNRKGKPVKKQGKNVSKNKKEKQNKKQDKNVNKNKKGTPVKKKNIENKSLNRNASKKNVEPKKSKGIFDYLKEFLTGTGKTEKPSSKTIEPKQKSSGKTRPGTTKNLSKGKTAPNNGKKSGSKSKNGVVQNKHAKGKANMKTKGKSKVANRKKQVKKPKPMTKAARNKLIAREKARKKALERQRARQKQIAQTRERYLARARQRAKERAKHVDRLKAAKRMKYQKKVRPNPKPKVADDFNIMPLSKKPVANQNTRVMKNKKMNKNSDIDSKNKKQNNNRFGIYQQHPPQIPRPPLHHHHHHQVNSHHVSPDVHNVKKGHDQLIKASVTTLLIGVCAVSLLALIVMLAVCRKVWGKDEVRYRPLKSYDEKALNVEQTETLLGTGPKHNLHSI